MATLLYNNLHPPHSASFSSTTKTRSHCISLNQVSLISVRSPRRHRRRTLTMAAESRQTPVINQQKVIIPNKHGEKLVGLLHEAGSSELVLLCHGFLSSKDNNTMVKLAAALEIEGITAFRFDFSGNGESEGIFRYGNYWREAEDLRSVVEYFTGLNRVITAVVGHSKGGGVVLLYASKYHDVLTVVNVSGRYNLKAGIVERLGDDYLERLEKDGFIDVRNRSGKVIYQVTKESMTDRLNTNMHDACLQINQNCRVLTVHGSKDEIIPKEDAIELSKIIPNHKLHIVEGANHGYTDHQKELASVVLSFIKKE